MAYQEESRPTIMLLFQTVTAKTPWKFLHQHHYLSLALASAEQQKGKRPNNSQMLKFPFLEVLRMGHRVENDSYMKRSFFMSPTSTSPSWKHSLMKSGYYTQTSNNPFSIHT